MQSALPADVWGVMSAMAMERAHKGTSDRRWFRFANIRLTALLAMIALAGLLTVSQDGVHADATCNVPPINLASALGEDNASVVLNWEASGECTPDEYAVYRRDMDVEGSRMTKIASVDGDVLTYTDTTVTAGEDYRYRIRSNDQGSRSNRTDITIPEATATEPEPESDPVEQSSESQPRSVPRNEVTLVGNFNQSGSTSEASSIQAQAFTTGSNSVQYVLNTVELRFTGTSNATTLLVKIFTTNSDGTPNAEHATLTNPDSIGNGTQAFTAPDDTTLDPSTTYAVVITSSIGGSLAGNVERIDSTGEDSGGADGWTIADNRLWKSVPEDAWTSDDTNLLKIRIKGTILGNNEPEFDAETATRTVPENSVSGTNVGDPVSAMDDDSEDTLEYRLTGTDASSFTIESASGQIKTSAALNFESKDSYSVVVEVRDSKNDAGAADTVWDDTIAVTINVDDVDEPPVITSTGAGFATISVAENTPDTTILATYTADDPENGTLVWTLTGADSNLFDLFGADLHFKDSPDYEDRRDSGQDNVYNVTVNVRDTADAVIDDTIAVAITVTNVNEPPSIGTVLISGERREGTPTSEVLATYNASDPESDQLIWSLSGPDAGDFTIGSGNGELRFSNVPDYENPADQGGNNVYNVTVQVRDGKNSQGGSDSAIDDTVAVTFEVVNVNEAPVITTTGTSFTTISRPENTATTAVLQTYAADDPETTDALTWTVTGPDAARFAIADHGDGQVDLKFSAVHDYENPTDVGTDNVYNVTVQVRDSKINTPGNTNGNADTMTDDFINVVVTVTNVDEPGTVTITGMESGGQELTASVTDIDGTVTSESWSWHRQGSTPGSFSGIPGATSNTYTTVAADVGKKLKAIVLYTDPQGSGKSANAETGTIGASNVEPSFSSMTATRSVAENSGLGVNVGSPVSTTDDDGDSLHYSLSGTDASSFTIVSTSGQIQTKSGITYNYESKSSYSVTVHVRDNKDAAGNVNSANDDDIAVTINLTDVNETPTIETTTTSISVAENQTGVLTYAADDPDNDNNEAHDASNTLTWSVETADDGSFFEIGATSGVLTFKNAPNFENRQDAGNDGVYNVTVTVTDNGIDGARGASNHLSVSKSLAVTVTDVNETPTLTTAPAAVSFDENATGVVATYIATDPDATTGTMSWDLMGNDAGDFNITSNVNGTAELRFKSPPDYEMPDDTGGNNVYDLTVRVRDNASPRLEDTQTIAVTVNDLNETPVIAGDAGPSFAEIEFDHTATASELVIGTYTATDDDNADNAGLQTITFDVSGTDAAHFSIDANTGVLSFSIEPDFENPADLADSNMMGASDNMYEIVVEADDGAGESNSVGTFPVTVTVTGVNETPEVPAGVPDENFAEIEWDADSADLDVMTYIPRDEEISILTQLSWSLAGTDAADFQITEDSTTGHGTLSFRNRPNFEDPTDRVNTAESHTAGDNMYEFIVKLSDGPNTREYPMTVTVTNINETPGFTAVSTGRHADEIEYDSGITAAEMSTIPATVPNQAYWYRVEARDEEGDDIIWTIAGPDAADFVIAEDADFVMTADADESAIARWNIVPDFEDPMGSSTDVGANGYVFTVNASDGTNTAMHEVFIRIFDVNERPEFTGTVETAIALDEHDATLDADFSEPPYAFPTIATYTGRDEEGGVTWSLTGTDAGDFEIDSGGNVVFKETPSFEDPKDSGGDNVYNFTVVTTDILSKTNRRTAEQPVTVTVRDIEETGVIQVSNLDPVVGDTISFTLSDPDGNIDTTATNISWTLRGQESGVWQPITIGSAASTTLSYTVDEDDAGKPLRAEVSYFDRRNADRNFANRKMLTSGETSPVQADPLPNVKPRFRSGTSQAIEEGPAGRILPERITATDRDGDNLTFAIDPGQDSALFEIDPSSGQITAVGDLDFETAGPQGLLFFTVSLHDGKGLDINDMVINDDSVDVTTDVSVRVIDVEEEGVVTLSDTEPEAGTPVTATLTDGDGGVTGQSWQWSRSQDGRSGWSPATGSGATTNRYTPTVSDEDSYLRAVVEYTDRRGGGKRAEAITNPVPSENRRPLFPSSETGQRTVDENSRAGTNVGAPVAAEDPENDRLTYTLTGADAASFTITGSGQIRVGSGATLDFETKSSYRVTVEVHDGKDGAGATSTAIDDTQNVTITVANVEEPGSVTLSSETATIQARVPVTATLEDDDIPTNVTWQWSRSRSSTSGWANIAGATSAVFTPDDTDAGNYIRAIASYDDGEGSGKTAVKVSPRIGQPPPVNSAPAFPATERGQRELQENANAGDPVGDPVAATDFNNDPLTYTLSGTDAPLFTVGANDGQLRVASGAQLDFETKRTLRVTVEVSDGADSLGDPDDDAIDDRQSVVITLIDVNEAPVVTGEDMPSFPENSDRAVATYTGTDPERDKLNWSVDNDDDFFITQSGALYFASPPDYEDQTSYSVTITATDDDPVQSLSGSLSVTVSVTDVEESGVVTITPPRGWVDVSTQLTAGLEDDDGSVSGEQWQWSRSSNRSSWSDIPGANNASYTATSDDVNQYLRATVSYTDRRGGNKEASASTQARIGATRPGTNSAPDFTETSTTRSIRQGSGKGRPVGAPVRAMDDDEGEVLTYELEGADAEHFTIDPLTGQIRTSDVLVEADQDTYSLDVTVNDGFDASYDADDGVDDRIQVVITVTGGAFIRSGSSGGGGGFGFVLPPPVAPSAADFDWNVDRDLDELDPKNENPTGIWSDGETIWVLENSTSGLGRVFAYELHSGDRLEEAEFELDSGNRFSHDIWSDGEVMWVADSGQDKLFAYRLEDGARLPDRDLELDERNRDPRGIWSDGTLMYVVDSRQDALFVYELASGELLAEYELDSLNRSPRGTWSDGVTIWISDDGANRVFAYRIEEGALTRLESEEFSFRFLLKAGNGDARGIWSDLEVLLVADAQDAKLYSYNMPDAFDARLKSLSLSSVEFGPFSPLRTEYRGTSSADFTTVDVEAAQDDASVKIEPADTDSDAESGHQVALSAGVRVIITVISPDGSRTRAYRVTVETGNQAPRSTALPRLQLITGEDPTRIDLATYFSDPDGDPLDYTLGRSSDLGVATAVLDNGVLVVTPVGPGTASVIVSASDGSLNSPTSRLSVTVAPAPTVAEARIAARRVAAGRVEFALQVRARGESWQSLILPQRRFLAADSPTGAWRVSTVIEVGAEQSARNLRIVARRLASGSVEFALLNRLEDGTWSARLLPRARFLPATAAFDRWHFSTPLDVASP
ncbi:MAG: hypothetical protein F4Y29_04160 [Chloroflexi bacterium]|nr:hypothetical protein [Chloroflexota bacterium]